MKLIACACLLDSIRAYEIHVLFLPEYMCTETPGARSDAD